MKRKERLLIATILVINLVIAALLVDFDELKGIVEGPEEPVQALIQPGTLQDDLPGPIRSSRRQTESSDRSKP